jgi:hypothetical protein
MSNSTRPILSFCLITAGVMAALAGCAFPVGAPPSPQPLPHAKPVSRHIRPAPSQDALPQFSSRVFGTTVIPFTRGRGSRAFQTLRIAGGLVTFELACNGPGVLTIPGWLSIRPCDGRVTFTNQYPSVSAQSVSLRLEADQSTRWELEVFDLAP